MYGDLSNTKFLRDGTPARATAVPRQGDRAKRQSHGRVSGWGAYVPPSACGAYRAVDGAATTTQACAYPYWSMLLWGVEPVYRLMRNQPTLSLARYIVTGPILASPWDVTWSDNIDKGDPAIRWVKDNVLPLRRNVMRDAVRCVDYGWQPFVLPWAMRDGKLAFGVRPVLPDATTVLQDDNGRFAGIENTGVTGGPDRFNDLESWAPSLDGEAGYAYGRSRFENVRDTAWAGWLNTVVRARELETKISGIIPIVTHPPGGYEDDDGNHVNYATEANTILQELPQGHGVRLETALDVAQLLENPELAKELAKLRLFDVQFLDAGPVAQAVVGFISQLEYWDKNLFRGMLRGERAGLEAVSAGSRADSEQHSMMGAADSESIDADLTEQFDEGPKATALRLNFGELQAREIRVISTPLQEWKQKVFRELIVRLVSIPELAVDVAKSLDVDAMLSQLSLPQLKAFVVEAALEKKEPGSGANGSPANGSSNGNGRANGEAATKAAAEHLAELLHTRLQ